MNGARTPRSAINSSTLSGESRSPKSRGSALDGLSKGLGPQNSVANVWGSVALQRLSTAKRSCSSVGTAVVTFGVRAAVGGTFAARGTVGSAVLTLWVRAAVGGTLAAVGRGGDVVVVEWHGEPFRHRICRE